jgi:bifunctional non-homologous end joining protein LigD
MPPKKKSPATAKKRLTRYRAKRDFTQTPEPTGGKPAQKSLAYCIQKHLASHLHYDFRLEHKGVLLSWAVPKGPSLRPADKRLAMRVEDHPFDYRTFEGVIPSGYGAGVVMLWDEGTWSPETGFDNIDAALAKGELKFRLDGIKLKGTWVLVRAGEKTPTGERERWLLIKHKDSWAGDVDVTKVAANSVKTEKDFEEIVKGGVAVWDSHKPGKEDLQAIVDKVMALKESEKPSPNEKKKKSVKSRQ